MKTRTAARRNTFSGPSFDKEIPNSDGTSCLIIIIVHSISNVWTYHPKLSHWFRESKVSYRSSHCLSLYYVNCGFLQIDLLGRVQKKQSVGKYYIRVAHVQATGRQLSPMFSLDISEQSNTLLYNDEEFQHTAKIVTQAPKTFCDVTMLPLHPSLLKFQIRLDMLKSITP
ncbi:hypothetical protein CTI12_AA610990 [Artemisia annua]|uniref:Uncharacterized protein n=1 Tax=Artemisia annua TaxID=35608 RepID=A0A2U1KET6_ARTAN|nr:hypothetical protein CTI12_AA610990 [Artemisia annua]